MGYKKGDKVKVRSLDWYNANKNSEGAVIFKDFSIFDETMSEFCGKIVTIDAYNAKHKYYDIKEDGKANFWYDEMFEGLAIEEPQEKMVSLDKVIKWLQENTVKDFDNKNLTMLFGSTIDMIEDFRKTMDTKNH